jgi:hypothetical protein
VDAVGRLLAVQAQDPRGMRLAVRARTRGAGAADVDAALSVDRALVVTWLGRGTLHLVRSEDHWWLRELTAPRMSAQIRRRLAQEGVSPDAAERGVELIEWSWPAVLPDGPARHRWRRACRAPPTRSCRLGRPRLDRRR